MVERDGRVIIVECKDSRSLTDEKFVEKWLNKNIPQTRTWLYERYPEIKKFEFQLWSLGGFTKEALQLLKNEAERVTKYDIDFFDKRQIIEMDRKDNVQKIIDILNEHYRLPLEKY